MKKEKIRVKVLKIITGILLIIMVLDIFNLIALGNDLLIFLYVGLFCFGSFLLMELSTLTNYRPTKEQQVLICDGDISYNMNYFLADRMLRKKHNKSAANTIFALEKENKIVLKNLIYSDRFLLLQDVNYYTEVGYKVHYKA